MSVVAGDRHPAGSIDFEPEYVGPGGAACRVRCKGDRMDTDDTPIGLGSQFIGTNHNAMFGEFEITSFIDAYEPDAAFGWRTSDVDNPGARWRFDLVAVGAGTRLRYSMILGPGPSGLTVAIDSMPDKEAIIIDRRVSAQHASMLEVLAAVKRTFEA